VQLTGNNLKQQRFGCVDEEVIAIEHPQGKTGGGLLAEAPGPESSTLIHHDIKL
jgi:hypothetical protein